MEFNYHTYVYEDLSPVEKEKNEENYYDLLPIPVFSPKDYEFWFSKMKTLFHDEGLLSLVENGFKEPPNETTYETLPQGQKIKLMDNTDKDDVALFLIQQGLNERILPNIGYATSAKEAWECSRREFDVRGTTSMCVKMSYMVLIIRFLMQLSWTLLRIMIMLMNFPLKKKRRQKMFKE